MKPRDVAVENKKNLTAFTQQLIQEAVDREATGIHLEPLENEKGWLRYRIDGSLRDQTFPDDMSYTEVIDHLKSMACLDMEVRNLPQDGRIVLEYEGRKIDLRVSVVPTQLGERMVISVLDASRVVLDLEQVVPEEDKLATVRELCGLSHGMVIVNGPVGSGKTTLLYAMLNEIRRPELCLFSVEDPVEYRLEGIAQVPVRPQYGVTFARVTRAVLRQDPDVISIAEIRDTETVQVALHAALTGRLVLSSLHADHSASAVQRLLDIGAPGFLVNTALAAVISQRLVRVLCPECKEPVEVQEADLPASARDKVVGHADAEFCRPVGCPACGEAGFRGRRAIHEILRVDDSVRRAIASEGGEAAVQMAAREGGMRTLLEDGIRLAAAGVTSLAEVFRVMPVTDSGELR